MCDACYEPGELEAEALRGAIADAREQIGPINMTVVPEPEYVARFVLGWHMALDYMEKKAGLA